MWISKKELLSLQPVKIEILGKSKVSLKDYSEVLRHLLRAINYEDLEMAESMSRVLSRLELDNSIATKKEAE